MALYRVPVRIDHPLGGGPAYNVFHVETSAVQEQLNLPEALDALEAFYTKIKTFYSRDARITIGDGIIADPYGSPTYADNEPRVLPVGTASGNASPLLCVTVAWGTRVATRRGRGRTFIGPLYSGVAEADGTPGASYLTILRTAASELVADSASTNGWTLGLWSSLDRAFYGFTRSNVRDRFTYLRSRRD